MKKNKKAWIKIVEAVIALILIVGVILILINRNYNPSKETNIEKIQIEILREIQLNEEYRDKILSIDGTQMPIEWDDFETNDLGDIKNFIKNRIPKNYECEAKLCLMDQKCLMNEEKEKSIKKDIYSQSVGITATLTKIEYAQLKLFCW